VPTKYYGSTEADGKRFRVLALEGGGMRGFYTAKLLQALARRFADAPPGADPDIGCAFDLIIGTSTGGILTCALAAGISMQRVADVYRQWGAAIFKHPIPLETGRLERFAATHLFSPANDGESLRKALESLFGSRTIGEVYASRRIAFCVQALEMAAHWPVVIKSGHVEIDHRDSATTLVDACMATTACPIVFPPARITIAGEERVMADGNLWAHSPIIPGLIEALKICGDRPIQIVSIGISPPQAGTFIPKESHWGLFRWKFGFGVVEASMDAQSIAAIHEFDRLHPHLRVPASLIRLHQDAPSLEYQRYIGVDRADQNAIDAMSDLAQGDADHILEESMQPGHCSAILADIFRSLPQIVPASNELAPAAE
jgi:uncharacterized protein